MLRASLALVMLAACATPAPPPPPPKAAPVADDEPTGPATWTEVVDMYASRCPGPFFELPKPQVVEAAGRLFTLRGSTLHLDYPDQPNGEGKWQGPLKIGVLGAIKDAEPDTRDNLRRAAIEFKRLGVQFVVANGDLVGDEAGDLTKVVKMLGEEIAVPVFAHSGNYEWTSAFTTALADGQKTWPQLFNANLLRHIDLGGVHLFSLPGWSNRKYVKAAACSYDKKDVDALEAQVAPLVAAGEVVIVTAHGPPRGRGKGAIDLAHEAGNVGDEDLARMLARVPVRFGIFSHILEAGGRATVDVTQQPPLKLPMQRALPSLFVNAGSVSSFPWEMLSKKTSRGMAAVFTVDDIAHGGKARVTFLKLR